MRKVISSARALAPNPGESLRKLVLTALTASLATIAFNQSSTLHVEASSTGDIGLQMDNAARNFARVTSRLTEHARAVRHQTRAFGNQTPFSLPMRVIVTKNGVALPSALTPNAVVTNSITLAFDSTGTRAFPTAYQAALQSTFDTAVSTINAVFGPPSASGTVFVRNYDADIGDRDALAGGYFTPNNGSGQAEIRFPVYLTDSATEVNFLHTILLAYLGTDAYGWDGFQEGLVRAAVMKIARAPGALPPTTDGTLFGDVLDSTYDVGATYDWYNQRALGGPVFIAPNLRSTPLPPGGSLGGLYLLRYQMSGSAWQKVLVQYPAFISTLNQAVIANPSLAQDLPSLLTECQQAMDTLAGSSGSTVEGLSFAQWFRRQFILETHQTNGSKILVEPVAITGGLSSSDYGVFIVQANYFQTLANGNETLLSGTCFPIFWDHFFDRLFPTVQESQMDIAGGYGSVVPNFPDLGVGIYRATVDLPVLDQNARAFLPAGSIATGSSGTVNNLFGTVENVQLQAGDTLSLQVTWPGSTVAPITVSNGAFGTSIADANFNSATAGLSVTATLTLTHASAPNVIFTRVINKGPGPLALDLRVNGEGTYAFSGGVPSGISMLGLPIDPFASSAPDEFGIAAGQLLLGRYNQARAQYDLYPDTEALTIGHGYFVRLDTVQPSFSIDGRLNPNMPTSVALRPGWNMIASPLPESVPTTSVKIVRSTSIPSDYAVSAGTDIGLDFFKFVPGANDPISGVPETGSMVSATSFEPGQAYFVRVLAAEGVSMVFFPSVPATGPYVRQPAPSITADDGWAMRFDLRGPDRIVSAFIGASTKATGGFDAKLDSLMPPGFGGFQLTSVGAQPLFRDIRELNQNQTYTLRMTGLTKGRRYSLDTSVVKGTAFRFTLIGTDGKAQLMKPGASYQFVATAPTQTVKVLERRGGY